MNAHGLNYLTGGSGNSYDASGLNHQLQNANDFVAQTYTGHNQGRFVVRACFAGPQEQFVASGSEDSQVYIWHRHLGTLVQVLAGHSSTVNAVMYLHGALGDASSYLLSASDDHTIRVWSHTPALVGEQDVDDGRSAGGNDVDMSSPFTERAGSPTLNPNAASGRQSSPRGGGSGQRRENNWGDAGAVEAAVNVNRGQRQNEEWE